MKRIAILACISVAILGLGACEKQSADTLPEKYQTKWSEKPAAPGHENAPAHGAPEKAAGEKHGG